MQRDLLVTVMTLSLATFSLANPVAASRFQVSLTQRTIVEGSAAHGGIQPNYVIDLETDEDLRRIMRLADQIRRRAMPSRERIRAVRDMVTAAMPRRAYDDPKYLALTAKYRSANQPIPLGQYLKAKAGVCREHSLVLHLALQRAGVANDVVYASVRQGSAGRAEDHGFVVLTEGEDQGITVDSYNNLFDGIALSELSSARGVTMPRMRGHRARTEVYPRRVVRIREYPRVYREARAVLRRHAQRNPPRLRTR